MSDDHLQVCHLVHELALGGLENQLRRIIAATKADIDFTVCYFGGDRSLESELTADDIRVVRLEHGSGKPLQNLAPKSLWRTRQFLQDEEFDVLHTHGSAYLHVLGRLCALQTGTQVVGTYHNTAENFNDAMVALERATRPLSAVNIAVSKGVERSFAGSAVRYPPNGDLTRHTYTIYNGIDVEEFHEAVEDADATGLRVRLGFEPSDLVFLCIGRYSSEKNQQALIAAMEDVVEMRPDARLVLVGWGPMEEELKQAAAEQGIADNVVVTGRVPTVHEYYAMADAFILPSLTEGLSVVLLEAMSTGLPIIGTDVTGTGEAIVHGETGLVVPPDSKRHLSHAMEQLCDGDRRREMAAHGRNRVQAAFSIDKTASLYTDVYRQIR